MKRALMYASVASMIQQFNMENIRLLLEQGYEVDVACNMEQGSTITQEKIEAMKQELEAMGVRLFHIPIPRKITALGQIYKSFCMSKALMNENGYRLIHCHSPIGGMICRIANRFSKWYGKTKVIYTAHGFHFYKGAPKKNWLMYYPVEWLCSQYTDVLITINQEDYALARSKMKARLVEYAPGVGIDVSKFSGTVIEIGDKRKEMGVPEDAVLLLSVGELNENKNHSVVVSILNRLPDNFHYIICGNGHTGEALRQTAAANGCGDRLHLLGYRSDIPQIMKACDIFVFPSLREGLPVSVMEAMASGLPCVVSRIRGNIDLIDENGGGLFDPHSAEDCFRTIDGLRQSDLRQMGTYNASRVLPYSHKCVGEVMQKIYRLA